jgi:hypothetical protein
MDNTVCDQDVGQDDLGAVDKDSAIQDGDGDTVTLEGLDG